MSLNPIANQLTDKIKIAIIGVASKKGSEYFKSLQQRDDVEIVACVVNQTVPEFLKSFSGEIVYNGDVDDLLKKKKFQIAVVTLPHHEHQKVTLKLLEAGVYVIKEKPLSLNTEQAEELARIIKERQLPPIFTTVQRSVHPSFLNAKEQLNRIGKIKSFCFHYCFALPSMTTGWRADKEKSGGGVLMDMGYHIIDIIHLYFGKPQEVKSEFGFCYEEMQERKLEDVARITMNYGSFNGEVVLHRHAEEKKEEFIIDGEKGRIVISPEGYKIEDENGQENYPITLSKMELTSKMFEYCLDFSNNRASLEKDFQRNIDNVYQIESIYQNGTP